MSKPKDFDEDLFGNIPDTSDNGSSDTVDLDELLKSIDRELGKTQPLDDPQLLDYDLYNEIFGGNTETENNQKSNNKKPSELSSQETKTIKPLMETESILTDSSLNEKENMHNSDRRYRAKANGKKAAEPAAGNKEQNQRKSGDNRNKFRLTGIRYVLFVLIISFILAYVAWTCVDDVFALNKPEITATVTIPKNFTMSQVASELKKEGIIEYTLLFRLFGSIAHADKKIDPGMYKLTSDLDYRAIVSQMQEGSSDAVAKVTIPEGSTLSEIFALLEQKGVCKAKDLQEAATNTSFNYKFLDSSTIGNEKRLEGYLFPDTYEFYIDEDPDETIKKFLDNFDAKVTDSMYTQAKKLGYSMTDIIKIASLIEKESANDSESSKIASVIYNRLKSSSFPYLQIDATVQYALPQRKPKLSNEDLKINSPYNTYKNKGLPPTPISNPGIESITAALNPENTNYYYYALNKSGSHSFFSKSSDFDAFVNSSNYGG